MTHDPDSPPGEPPELDLPGLEGSAPETSKHQVTELLLLWNDGNKEVVDRLMPLVAVELRRLADSYLQRERVSHTLQPTALVNELYFRLVDRQRVDWKTRAQFFAFASHTMRRILVDHARGRNRYKRGGGAVTISLADAGDLAATQDVDLVALDEAMTSLGQVDEQLAKIVELRYFGGLTSREIATILDSSKSTVSRQWTIAKGWLFKQLKS